jgi:hypothetical protein
VGAGVGLGVGVGEGVGLGLSDGLGEMVGVGGALGVAVADPLARGGRIVGRTARFGLEAADGVNPKLTLGDALAIGAGGRDGCS